MNRHATNYHPECERARAHPSSHCPHDSLPRMNANEYIRKTSSVDPGTRSRNSDIVVPLQMSVASLSVRTVGHPEVGAKPPLWNIMEHINHPRPMRLPAIETRRRSRALDIGA